MHRITLTLLAVISPVTLCAAPATASSASTCVQPGGQGAQIVPTQTFKLLPHNTLITLVNPLNPNDASTLTMLTFGDSAMWGNGLNIDHKYSHQVARHIADATGRVVNFITYAHSGANLSTEAGQSYEPLKPSDNGRPPGDLNAGLPTTLQQEACAATKYAGAEVILLNGCINDVSAEAIGLPFPLIGAGPAEIKSRALKQCSEPMRTLLKNTQDDYPRATIIVSNYWLIISDKSSPAGVTMKKRIARSTSSDPALNKEFDDLISAQLKAEHETGKNFVEAELQSDPAAIFRKWSDNSRAFLDTSQDCLVWAVGLANAQTTPDLCPHALPSGPQLASQNWRVFLATVPDKPEFAYGAGKEKRLWSVPLVPRRYDQEYVPRHALCMTHYPLGKRFICRVNPTAHPNVAGAKAYTDSINTILDVAWKMP
jgi:hypothetical protein